MKKTPKGALSDTDSLVVILREESLTASPPEFLAVGSVGRDSPGMYSWWVDATGARDLSKGLGHAISAGMIYAGLAGATRWPSGKRSSNTLWLRIAKMHLGPNHNLSTFRYTVGAILARAEGVNFIDEQALTQWMHSHLRVLAVPYPDADSLGQVEEVVLAELDPPFNLKGMPKTPIRSQITILRREVDRKVIP